MNHQSSREFFSNAKKIIPGGVHSPVRSFKGVGSEPIFFKQAEGATLTDVDGNHYIDYCMSFGPHILGHSHPKVVRAVEMQLKQATSFGACHPKEVELSNLILKAYSFLNQVRLLSSGTEAVMTAIRLARGYTKRSKILKFEGCYHGHADAMLVNAGSGVAELSEASSSGVTKGVTQDTLVAKWDDVSSFERLFKKYPDEIAAVIIEPIPANYGLKVPLKAFLEELCMTARLHGSLIIFDEVISGFRVGLQGASHYYDLKPDIVTLGKIIGGGLPLAALVGTERVMRELAPVGNVYQAGTLSGNPLATAAGIAVLDELYSKQPYLELEKKTAYFAAGLNKIFAGNAHVSHFASLFWISFNSAENTQFPPVLSEQSKKNFSKFYLSALDAGVYFAPSPYEVGFISTAHTQAVLDDTLEKLKKCSL